MRKLLVLIVVCFTGLSHAQEIKLIDNKFTTQVMDGSNQLKTISFSISNETIDKIKQSESYLKTVADTEFLKKNLEKRGISDPLVVHLFSKVNSAILDIKYLNTVPSSVSFIDDSSNIIYIIDNQIAISVNFKYDSKSYKGVYSKHGAKVFN